MIGVLGSNADLGMPIGSASIPKSMDDFEPSHRLPTAPEGNVDGRRYAKDLGIGVKAGANISSIDGELVPAMAAAAAEANRLGLPKPIITSGNDSRHEIGSSHYDNRGLDFRGRKLTEAQGKAWAAGVSTALGNGYGVQFEIFPDEPGRNHLHITKRKT